MISNSRVPFYLAYFMKAKDLEKFCGDKEKTLDDLKEFISVGVEDAPKYAFLLGAGASKTSGINTGQDLVDSWRESEYNKLNKGDKSKDKEEIKNWLKDNAANWYEINAEYSSLFQRKFANPKLRQGFIEKEVSGKTPSIGYAYLVKLAEKQFINTIFTTNFDDLLNEAFYQFSAHRPIVCAHDSEVSSISVISKRSKLIKLHGDYLFHNLKSGTQETAKLESNMESKLKEFCKNYGLIVSGYSGGDKSIMSILDDMLDDEQMVQNGIFWCFREEDEINEELFGILKRENVFYVIVDGFDELMAELYGGLCGDSLPFSARPGSDFSANIVKSYLDESSLRTSNSKVIRDHLEMLEDEQNSSLVIEAIQKLNAQKNSTPRVKDDEMLKFVEIERLTYLRLYDQALEKIRSYIDTCENEDFQKMLYRKLFDVAYSLYDEEQALHAVREMIKLEPKNTFVYLAQCDVIDDIKEKISILDEAVKRSPYEESIHNYRANELLKYSEICEDLTLRPEPKDIVDAFQRAIEVNPSIENQAYADLFDYAGKSIGTVEDRLDIMEGIVRKHIVQDAYSLTTMMILKDYFEYVKVDTYEGKNLSTWISDSYANHFPRNESGYLSLLYPLVIKLDNYPLLKQMIENCEKEKLNADNSRYVRVKMQLMYNVYRDIDGAIDLAEKFLKKRKSLMVERELFDLYLDKKSFDKAESVLLAIKHAITWENWMKQKARLYEAQGNYQDAIDIYNDIGRRKGITESLVTAISLNKLHMEDYDGALKDTKSFLDKKTFNPKYAEVIINYEFARMKKNSNKKATHRVKDILKDTVSKDVMASCNLLLGNAEEALTLLVAEMENDFSRYQTYMKWVVTEPLKDQLTSKSDDLFNNRRQFPTV